MARLSIRLPEDLHARLGREAEAGNRPRSAVARQAIVEYLARRECEQFLGAIARAARAARAEGEDPLAIAEEALPLDNEALALAEEPRVQS
jgi:predicted transcriptional regulator